MSHSGFQSLSSSDLQQHDAEAAAEQVTAAQAHAATAAATGVAGSQTFDGDELENGSSASTPLSSPDASLTSASVSASGASAAVSSLRQALNAAQTRARQSEDANQWIYEHVHSSVAAAIKEVSRAKKRVKAIKIETKGSISAAQQQQQQGSMSARSSSDSSSIHHGGSPLPHSQSSSAGLTVSSARSAGLAAAGDSFMLSSASSPHREAYLSALASPAGAAGSLASSPRTMAGMPSLALGSAALSASQVAAAVAAGRGAAARSDEQLAGSTTIIEGSYCLLPFEADPLAGGSLLPAPSPTSAAAASATATPAPPSALHHSSSHQAMLEAHEAMEELRRDTTGSASASGATSAASSLQTSPLGAADDQPSAASYPSLPALHPVSSPSHAFSSTSAPGSFANVNSILATSPYHIAPSTALPPLQRGRSLGAIGSSVGATSRNNVGSPRMQPHSPATMHAAQAYLGSSSGSSTTTTAAGSTTTPAPSIALTHALQSLHQAQSRFSTLAQFCAPLILRSPSVARLKEEVALQQLGVVPPPPPPSQKDLARSASSDEELSRSAEMQLEDLAAVAALASSVESSSGSALSRGDSEERIESQSEEEKKQPASATGSSFSSLVIVPSASASASSHSVLRPKLRSSHAIWETQTQPKSEAELAEEKEAMRMYISQLRAEVASADEAGAHKDEETPQAPLTLDQALEGCVLLHQLLLTAQTKLDALDSSAAEVADASARLVDLQAANASLRASLQAAQSDLAELRRSHEAQAVKIANMERILALLEVPLTDKGTVREDFRFVKRSSGLWTSAALTLVFGGLVIVSAMHWKRIIKAIRATVPRILNQLGLGGGEAAKVAAAESAGGAAAAAQAAQRAAASAAAAPSPAAAAVAATVEAASQTAAQSASIHASTNTPAHTYGPRLFSHVFRDGGSSRALNITRFPSIQDFLSNLSLQLVQIA